MNSALKGTCLSGLVYPGLGQIVQKHYWRGIALIGIVTASLFAMTLTASRHMETMLADIESGHGEYDVTTLLQGATEFSSGPDSGVMKGSSVLIFCCWAIGIGDAYLSGKRIDSQNRAHNQAMQPTGRTGG
jgi:hypothetical protein